MSKRQRRHPDYYYSICDGVIAKMGPEWSEADYRAQFSKVARLYNVIPGTEGYAAHWRIIRDLVRDKMRRVCAAVPKRQNELQFIGH